MTQHNPLFKSRLSTGAFYFAAGLIFASWASRIPDVKDSLDLSDGTLGTLLLSIPAGQLTMMAISGYLVTRFGSKVTLISALLAYMSILLCIPSASSAVGLMAVLFCFGIASNLLNISVNTQACEVETKYGRNIMSSFHGLWSLGAVSGGLTGMLFAHLGCSISTHYFCVAIFSLMLLIVSSRNLLSSEAVRKDPAKNGLLSLKKIDVTIILLAFIAFGGMFCEGTLFDWSSVYFASVVRPDDGLIRLGYVAGLGTMTIGRFCADRFVARYHAPVVLQVCGMLVVTGLLLATLLPTLLCATLGFMFVGIGISSIIPICFSLAGHQNKIPTGIAITAVSSVSFFGFLIGPPLIGYMSDWFDLRVALGSASLIGLLITVLSLALRRRLSRLEA